MKRKIIYSFIAIFAFASMAIAQKKAYQSKEVRLNIMSFNMRYDNPDDKENNWQFRKNRIKDNILFNDIDIVGSQELLHHQLQDLINLLPQYSSIGLAREDAISKGEYSAILYRKDKFEIIDSGNFWLSENPNAVGVKGWDAACERICTWAIFMHKKEKKKFLFMNTHLDHIGQEARRNSIDLILSEIKRISKNNLPVILTGDFNATPDDEIIHKVKKDYVDLKLEDAFDIAKIKKGPEWTFHNFGKLPNKEKVRIDYIFLKNIKVNRYSVDTDYYDGVYISDHYPVISEIIF